MATPFGQPIYAEHEGDDPTQPAAAPEAEVLDINDPAFTSENIEINPEVDAYAFPPPPPDGRYRAKLKLSPRENAAKEKVDYLPAVWGSNPPQKVLVTGVEAAIIDPSGTFEGYKVYDRQVSTFIQREGSKVTTVLSFLQRPDGAPWATTTSKPHNLVAWMELLKQALAGEPEVGIETQWEWSCAACGEAAKKTGEKRPRSITGMHKFPQFKGKFSPEMRCSVNPAHGESRAQVRIARFLKIADLGKK